MQRSAPTTRSPPTSASSRPSCTPRSRPTAVTSRAQALASRLEQHEAKIGPLLARLADWVHSLGVDNLATVSTEVSDHHGPLTRLDERAGHQMSESEEGLYAELSTTGSGAWGRLQSDITSQLTTDVTVPRRACTETMPMPAVRGLGDIDRSGRPAGRVRRRDGSLATDRHVGRGRHERHQRRGQQCQRRRHWESPLDASLFANSVSRATFDAMQQAAVTESLPDFRAWMRTKARLHGHTGGLPWWDLEAPLPHVSSSVSWAEGIDWVRGAFATYSDQLGRTRRSRPRRALDRRRTSRRQDRRSVLHVVQGRPVTGAAQLGGLGQLSPDHRSRTRPRLPQHDAGWPHGTPEAGADGARRDSQHLLRDTRRRGRAEPTRWPGTTGPARRRPGQLEPGRGRHPLAVPVRVQGVRPAQDRARSASRNSTI